MIDVTPQIRTQILQKYFYTCQKCGYHDESGEELAIHVIPKSFKDMDYVTDKLTVLCKICNMFAPKEERYINAYINEKIPWEILETFRKAGKSTSKRTKKGMQTAKDNGKITHRPPMGYKVVDGKLVVDDVAMAIVKQIFNDHNTGMSLNKIAKKYSLSVPGIKKIIENKVYD